MDRCILCLHPFSHERPQDECRPICYPCSCRFDALTEADKAAAGAQIVAAEMELAGNVEIAAAVRRLNQLLAEALDRDPPPGPTDWFTPRQN